jgi:hypothetical protein
MIPPNPAADKSDAILAELRAIVAELRAIRTLVDRFATAYLNSKFPFGRATDRWARR